VSNGTTTFKRRPIVFISSVGEDFVEDRKRIRHHLRRTYDAYLYEDQAARPDAPESYLREVIGAARAYVGIHGRRFGSTYEWDSSGRSIVEWEEAVAVEGGKPVLHFIRKPLVDVEPKQEAFLRRIRDFRGRWCREFRSTRRLLREVRIGLEVHFVERLTELENERPALRRRGGRPLLAMGVTIQIAVCVLAGVGWMTFVEAAAANVAILATAGGVRLLLSDTPFQLR
jgi:hypothetical protein